MAPINADHAAEAARRMSDFFFAFIARPMSECDEAVDALLEGLDIDRDALNRLRRFAVDFYSTDGLHTTQELEELQTALEIGVYLGLTAEQLRSEAVTV